MEQGIPSLQNLQQLLQSAVAGPVPAAQLRWLAPLIDHTLLKPDTTEAQVIQLCEEARQYGFGAVCVYPRFVALCRERLQGSGVNTVAVVGFPKGTNPTAEKVAEARQAIRDGAAELDMVIQLDRLKVRDLQAVFSDIQSVVEAAGSAPVKVILETSDLDEEEKIMGAALAKAAGASFLKTSTGFSKGGATEADIALLRRIAARDMGVKASGGVRNLETALRMVISGADRIGTSSGVGILGNSPSGQSGLY